MGSPVRVREQALSGSAGKPRQGPWASPVRVRGQVMSSGTGSDCGSFFFQSDSNPAWYAAGVPFQVCFEPLLPALSSFRFSGFGGRMLLLTLWRLVGKPRSVTSAVFAALLILPSYSTPPPAIMLRYPLWSWSSGCRQWFSRILGQDLHRRLNKVNLHAGSLCGSKLCGHAGRYYAMTVVAIALEVLFISLRSTLLTPVYMKPR